jgi:hypothetical protein
MAFTKITNEDRLGKGNVGQPDTPLLSATEMQEQMDSLPNLAIDKFNAFLDEIADISASSNIGCTAPVGVETQSTTLYGVLNAIAATANAADDLAHSHANKEALDSLTAPLIRQIISKAMMLARITEVEKTITDNTYAVPSSSAVVNYVNNVSLSRANLNLIYPIGSVYLTMSTSPEELFGGAWSLIHTDASGIKFYARTGLDEE